MRKMVLRIGKRAALSVCFGFALFLSLPQNTFAQTAPGEIPTWRTTLTCEPDAQKFNGFEYCFATRQNSNLFAHVIVVDLTADGIRFEYIIADGVDGECRDVNLPSTNGTRIGCSSAENRAYYPVISLPAARTKAERLDQGLALVINTDYGAGTQDQPDSRGHGPEGLTVVRGHRLDGLQNGDDDNNAERRPWFVIGKEKPLRAELGQYGKGQDPGTVEPCVYVGVGGGPWLVKGGQPDTVGIENCLRGRDRSVTAHSCGTADHTAVALSQDGRWLFLVLVKESSLQDIADFLADDLDAWSAIKFDGGGSSQLWYGGIDSSSDQTLEAGDGRRLSQYLAVYASAGAGIKPDTPEVIPLDRQFQQWLQDRQQQMQNAWRDFQEGVRREIDAARLRAQEWFAAKFAELRENAQREIDAALALAQEWLAKKLEELQAWIVAESTRLIEEAIVNFEREMQAACSGNALLIGVVGVAVIFRRKPSA